MKNILVPIGSNPDSHATLQYAIDFGAEFSAVIYAMEVFNVSAMTGNLGNVTEVVAESSKERLREIISKVDAKSLTIKIATYNGDIVDGLNDLNKELGIDLIVLSPRSNDVNEELYLGKTSGKIVKRTNIPALIVPKDCQFKPYKTILTAFRSGILKRKRILMVLERIKNKFGSKVNLLLVKTPGYSDEDLKIDTALMDISSHLTITENQTTYLGVLEHFRQQHPDLLVVFRRKRGFFHALWEKNTIPKSEFSSPVPVLVLSVKKE